MRLTPRRASRSLRGRLLWLLGWSLLGMVVLSAAYDYWQGLSRARDDQDLALSRIAIALSSRLDVDADDAKDDDLGLHLERTMQAMQRADPYDELQFLVVNFNGELIGGDLRLSRFLQTDDTPQARFFDQTQRERNWRMVEFPHQSALGPVRVLVAETTDRRLAQARQVLVDTIAPNVVLVLAVLWLVRWGVEAAMRPLEELDQAIDQRSTEDLSPLPTQAVLAELLPLVNAINRLMAHLQQAAQAQQAFLSNAAHQLRTPLAGVQTQIELAQREAGRHPALLKRLEAAQAALRRMARSTQQMLALARSAPQAAQAEPFQPLDLQCLLEEAASIWIDPALASGIDLGFDTAPAAAIGSPWMLHEAIGNLIHNALRHAPAGGRVTVSCGTTEPGGAWLAVEDDGPGIPPEQHERVFERFYRAPGSAAGGTGLGLAIVREVAQRHGAAVLLDSGAGGLGLRITLSFPPLSL
jgi:two-component system sensor histidine kinase TctE